MKTKGYWLFFFIICAGVISLGCGLAPGKNSAEINFSSELKFSGVSWDGENFWVLNYQSAPLKCRILKLGADGTVIKAIEAPGKCVREDIHNFGVRNITFDGENFWISHWNEGKIYQISPTGEILTSFTISEVGTLLPTGLTWDGRYLWVLHWSNKTIYQVDTSGNVIKKISVRRIKPPLDSGLAWDGEYLWVGSERWNKIGQINLNGNLIKVLDGPRETAGIQDLDWNGERLLVVYRHNHSIYTVNVK